MTRLFSLLAAIGCFASGLALLAVEVGDITRFAGKPRPVDWRSRTLDPSDIGPDLSPTSRRCHWDQKIEPIGNTHYSAYYGPWYYEEDWKGGGLPWRLEPVIYRIEIRTPKLCGSWPNSRPPPQWPSFRRDFRKQDLPEGFLSKPITEVVSFDEAGSVITLRVGERLITWKVPRAADR
jgi:hypothetical protein